MYGTASLVHFFHNAEFLAEYPNMPPSWSRAGVYAALAGLTATGVLGWLLMSRGKRLAGLCFVALYAALGIDSLGHYVLAPMSAHTTTMNFTILAEVTAAALLLLESLRLMAQKWR
jgi:hypothetical protein